MAQPTLKNLSTALKEVMELEQRCEQIEAAITQLRNTVSDPAAFFALDAIGIADGLRWHLGKSLQNVVALEKALGVNRPARSKRTQPAKGQAEAGMLRGSTRNLALPDLIGLLSAQEKTGTLWVKSKEETFILELLRGAVVHVMSDSPRPEQRLGTILVAHNKISNDKLEEFLKVHGSSGGRIGEMMARTSLVSEDDLRDALEWQVKELFQRIFGLEHAVFCFREGEISKLELRVSLNATQLLLEAATNQDQATNKDQLSREAAALAEVAAEAADEDTPDEPEEVCAEAEPLDEDSQNEVDAQTEGDQGPTEVDETSAEAEALDEDTDTVDDNDEVEVEDAQSEDDQVPDEAQETSAEAEAPVEDTVDEDTVDDEVDAQPEDGQVLDEADETSAEAEALDDNNDEVDAQTEDDQVQDEADETSAEDRESDSNSELEPEPETDEEPVRS